MELINEQYEIYYAGRSSCAKYSLYEFEFCDEKIQIQLNAKVMMSIAVILGENIGVEEKLTKLFPVILNEHTISDPAKILFVKKLDAEDEVVLMLYCLPIASHVAEKFGERMAERSKKK